MSLSVESAHIKIVVRLDIIHDFTDFLKKIIEQLGTVKVPIKQIKSTNGLKFGDYISNCGITSQPNYMERIQNLIGTIAKIQNRYYDCTSNVLSRYYDMMNSETPGIDNKKLFEEYQQIIVSNSIFDQTDRCIELIAKITNELMETVGYQKILTNAVNIMDETLAQNIGIGKKSTFKDTLIRLRETYDDNKVIFTVVRKIVNNCDLCFAKMTVFPNTSEMRCDSCGNTVILYGTVFEDSQFYTQQGQCTKHKKYDPNRHCEKWLNQIQAKENKTIPAKIIEKINKKAIKEYTRGGKLRSMNDMKCRQIREWFKEEKEEKLTKYNDHAALIRKIITGQNGEAIIPPQLTVEENQEILIDFSRAMDLYEKVRKREDILQMFSKNKIRNKLYYPYGLLKILSHKLKNDPRKNALIECIHFQSANTVNKDDVIWQEICKELDGYIYEPTDRTLLVEIL